MVHDLHVVEDGFVSDDVMCRRGWHVLEREVLTEVVSLGGRYFSCREAVARGHHICKREDDCQDIYNRGIWGMGEIKRRWAILREDG